MPAILRSAKAVPLVLYLREIVAELTGKPCHCLLATLLSV